MGATLHAAQTVSTDVCVYGGGSGGVAAAVEAARMGKSVALLVFNNHLGGMTSSGLSSTDIGANGDSYIQGIAREFYTRVGAMYGGTTATFVFEPHIAEAVFDQMAADAGVQVYFGQQLASAQMSGGQIVQISTLDGSVFQAKAFIDASYEGDLLKQAGVSYTVGREAISQYGEGLAGIQYPGTGGNLPAGIDPYVVPGVAASGLLPGVNAGAGGAPGTADEKIQAYCYRMCLTSVPSNRIPVAQPPGYNEADYELLFRSIAAGQTSGFWGLIALPDGKDDANNGSAVSTDFVGMDYAYPEADYATRAQIALAHQNWQLGLIWTIQNDPRVPESIRDAWSQWGLAADEFTDNNNWPPVLYVREARRMVSDYVMTENNCLGKAVAADSIALAAYTIDSHNVQRVVSNGAVQNEGDAQAAIPALYPVSYRSIVPKSTECGNLLVPWCLSASHIAFDSLRTEPMFMMLGQAAGAAAAISIDDGVTVQNVSYPKLKAQLTADGQAVSSEAAGGIIVDNSASSGVVITGSWYGSTAVAGYYGANYIDDGDTGQGSKSVEFIPTLPASGNYNVYMRWTQDSNRASNVPVDIVSASGTTTLTVNERQNGSEWVLMGTFPFTSGTSGSVLVRTTGANAFVIADAVSFVALPATPVVSLWASDAQASVASAATGAPVSGRFTLSRTGSTLAPLTVQLSIGGSAIAGVNYTALPRSVTFPAGSSSVSLAVTPRASVGGNGAITVTASVSGSDGYVADAVLNAATIGIAAVRASPTIIGALQVTATAGMPFTYQIGTINKPTSYIAEGLPAGLSLDSATGLITGTAENSGTANVTIGARNFRGLGTASLNITILDTFSSWRSQWFGSSNLAQSSASSETAAPAGDGIPNLMKYALALPPYGNGVSGLPVTSVSSSYGNNYLTLTYTSNALASDLTYIVEVSNDLKTWKSGPGYTLTLSTVANPDGLTSESTVEDITPAGATPQFIRLRVVGP